LDARVAPLALPCTLPLLVFGGIGMGWGSHRFP